MNILVKNLGSGVKKIILNDHSSLKVLEDKIKICILVFTNTKNNDGASSLRPKKIIDQFKKNHKNVLKKIYTNFSHIYNTIKFN